MNPRQRTQEVFEISGSYGDPRFLDKAARLNQIFSEFKTERDQRIYLNYVIDEMLKQIEKDGPNKGFNLYALNEFLKLSRPELVSDVRRLKIKGFMKEFRDSDLSKDFETNVANIRVLETVAKNKATVPQEDTKQVQEFDEKKFEETILRSEFEDILKKGRTGDAIDGVRTAADLSTKLEQLPQEKQSEYLNWVIERMLDSIKRNENNLKVFNTEVLGNFLGVLATSKPELVSKALLENTELQKTLGQSKVDEVYKSIQSTREATEKKEISGVAKLMASVLKGSSVQQSADPALESQPVIRAGANALAPAQQPALTASTQTPTVEAENRRKLGKG